MRARAALRDPGTENDMESLMVFLQKWRVRLGHLFAIGILVFARPTPAALAAGTAVALLGEAIRIYSAGVIDKNTTLSRTGPYAYTRNPLYVGSFFMYLGFCIAAGSVYVVAAFLVFFFVVYYATILREEAFLREKFGDSYERFCGEVPRFFPRPGGARPEGEARFDWGRMKENKEHEGLIATLIILGVLWGMWLSGRTIYGMIGG